MLASSGEEHKKSKSVTEILAIIDLRALIVDGRIERVLYVHSRRPSLAGTEERYEVISQSCKIGTAIR